MHPFIGCHHNLFIFGKALDLLLDIAAFMSTPVVTPGNQMTQNEFIFCNIIVLFLKICHVL